MAAFRREQLEAAIRRLYGCEPIASGTWIANEAVMDAASSKKQKIDMTTIGSFKANSNEFTGENATLTIQGVGFRIVPAKRLPMPKPLESTPDRLRSGRIGASTREGGRN